MTGAGDQAFGIARLAIAADQGADIVDRARAGLADDAGKRCTAVADRAHAAERLIDVGWRYLGEFSIRFQRKARPVRGRGTAGAAAAAVELTGIIRGHMYGALTRYSAANPTFLSLDGPGRLPISRQPP